MKTSRLGLIVLLIVFVASVMGAAAQAEPNDEISLIDTQWLLTAISTPDELMPVIQGSIVSLSFEGEDRITGHGGCNQYGGSYALGDDDTITFSEVFSTLMACSENDRNSQEQTYLAALNASTRYEVTENQLTLWSDDEQALYFVRTDVDVLLDTQWHLVSSGDPEVEVTAVPTMNENEITLEFLADHQAGGSGGCNQYSTNYTIDGTRISFSDVVSTRMACADRMQQESDFFAALSSAEQFALVGDQLVIWYEDGQRLTFANANEDNAMESQITVSPMSGAAGTEVTVSGSGFPPNSNIVIAFGLWVGDMYRPVGEAQTLADGTFSVTVTIPATADPDEDWVFMAAVPGTARTLSDMFDVTGS